MTPTNVPLQSCPALIAVVTDDSEVRQVSPCLVQDYAAATENMWLAITALGYATVWLDGLLKREQRAQRIGELLDVPEGKIVRVLLPIGVPKETWTQKEKQPFDERAWHNQYGQ